MTDINKTCEELVLSTMINAHRYLLKLDDKEKYNAELLLNKLLIEHLQVKQDLETVKRPEFTREQEHWLINVLEEWYFSWKDRITESSNTHYLGIAKEQLKAGLCGENIDKVIENIVANTKEPR